MPALSVTFIKTILILVFPFVDVCRGKNVLQTVIRYEQVVKAKKFTFFLKETVLNDLVTSIKG